MSEERQPGKKRPQQHRTDDAGVELLQSVLPRTQAFEIKFKVHGTSDYGIDGEFQIFEDEIYTGEVYKGQLKSTESPKYSRNGGKISFSIDFNTAYLLVEQVSVPTVLLLADMVNKKVFWAPVQTDPRVITAIHKKLASYKNGKNPTITVGIDVTNEISPTSSTHLYEHLKQAHLKLSRRALINTRTNKTLSIGMAHLDEVEEGVLELKGFIWRIRNDNDPLPPGVVFSIVRPGGKAVDYLPGPDFSPELAPTVNLVAKFSTKSEADKTKFEAFQKAVKEGKGSVELDNENIAHLEAVSGSTIIDKSSPTRGYKLSIGPSIQRTRHTFLISNGKQELQNTVEIWPEDNLLHFASVDTETLGLKASFHADRAETTCELHINTGQLSNVNHHLSLMEFIRKMEQITVYAIDPQGFKRKIFWGELNTSNIVPENMYRFIKALSEIEAKTGVPIPYPLPTDITKNQIYDVYWLHRLLTEGRVIKDVSFKVTLRGKPPEDPIIGGAMSFSQNPPEIYIFGRPYVIPHLRQTITGVISELGTSWAGLKPSYSVKLKNAEISVEAL